MNTLRSIAFVLWLYAGMAVIGIGALPTMLLPRRFALGAIAVYAQYIRIGLRIICGIRVELRAEPLQAQTHRNVQ